MYQINPAITPIKLYTMSITALLTTIFLTLSASQKQEEPRHMDKGACTIKNGSIEVKNSGSKIGMVEVTTNATLPAQKTVLLVNATKETPNNTNDRQEHLGYGSHTCQKIGFRGPGKINCYECGTTANDPNDRPAMCPDPTDKNNCLTCSKAPVDCNITVTLTRCHAEGQNWSEQAEWEQQVSKLIIPIAPSSNLFIRLGLIQTKTPAPPTTPTPIVQK